MVGITRSKGFFFRTKSTSQDPGAQKFFFWSLCCDPAVKATQTRSSTQEKRDNFSEPVFHGGFEAKKPSHNAHWTWSAMLNFSRCKSKKAHPKHLLKPGKNFWIWDLEKSISAT